MSGQHPGVRRTWRTRLLVEFSHFVLFDFSGSSSLADLHTATDSHRIGRSGPGGVLLHATDFDLEADVVVELHDTDPGTDDHSWTGEFHTDSGTLLLASATGAPGDIPVDLPAPGDYRLRARRLPELIDTSFGDEARCEQWVLCVWPAPRTPRSPAGVRDPG
ncbi:hypothetical protein [Umezawaea beigongshangensis]|uniref:hypothetical protein n=1 Tax=Umezawaea beigongshangensis TaxID=2780383 RepID=UPI0018F1E0A0|nr:hypothetical protein [Umezawaea beigongshangensis]